jgi:hypothetical protein
MSVKRPDEHNKKQADEDRRQWRVATIGSRVLHVLGQPDDLQRVEVRPLWQGHYRVNVLVGADVASMRVAHSFFLVADEDGNLLQSAPEITKQY